ncbi:MAG TPA: aldo/keto reductase [Anaerolineae bacterium]|nr:aldo/keto reductase [Anaerolineae bacterium]
MEYRKLGRTGLKVSALCMGTMNYGWTAPEENAAPVLDAFVAAGGNFIDTADVYSRWAPGNPGGVAETLIGKWLKQGHVHRDQIILATKVRGRMGEGPNDEGLSRKHILDAVEASLRRLQTDYIDLYQTHFYDENTPIEETLRALDDLVRQGKVRYLGCSNYPAWRLMEALWSSAKLGLARFDSLQPHYNLVHRAEFERELRDVCQTYGLGVIPYSPLAAGFLTGKYRKGEPPPVGSRGAGSQTIKRYIANEANFIVIAQLRALGEPRGKSVAQMALAWLLADPLLTSPIIGANTVEQWNEIAGALDVKLSEDEKQELDEASKWE